MSCEIMKGTFSSEFFSVIDCPTLYATSTKMSSLLYIFFCGSVLEEACSCSESDNEIKHNEFLAIQHQSKALFIKMRRGLSETLVDLDNFSINFPAMSKGIIFKYKLCGIIVWDRVPQQNERGHYIARLKRDDKTLFKFDDRKNCTKWLLFENKEIV